MCNIFTVITLKPKNSALFGLNFSQVYLVVGVAFPVWHEGDPTGCSTGPSLGGGLSAYRLGSMLLLGLHPLVAAQRPEAPGIR